jgi:hypothetical protein
VELLKKNFKIKDLGTLNDYLGVNIEKREDGELKLTQPTLTCSIKNVGNSETGKKNDAKPRETPACHTTILTKDEEGEGFNNRDLTIEI